ncbi:MAG: type II toxin-antitoxin system HigB family toxin [Acidobacteriaceae bacterium]|jgi:mRNA interferase HigB
MHVVTEKHLKEAAKQYPGAAAQIAAWRAIARDARWRSFIDLQQVFSDADRVGDYVIFNIGRNRYRLVTIIHYSREPEGGTAEGHIWIRSFLTNKQYENAANWDKGVVR